jgi:hypothetical protein
VFSNGIFILGFFACLLLVIFHGDTHALIPLYAIGVFVSFTLSQAGMVKRWLVKRGLHWRKKLVVNGIGAITTGVATVIIATTKFMQGAWIVFLLVAILIMMFRGIRSHYKAVAEQVALTRDTRPPRPRRNLVIMPIGGVNRSVVRAVDYARSRGGEIRAILVDVDKEETALVEIKPSGAAACRLSSCRLPTAPFSGRSSTTLRTSRRRILIAGSPSSSRRSYRHAGGRIFSTINGRCS